MICASQLSRFILHCGSRIRIGLKCSSNKLIKSFTMLIKIKLLTWVALLNGVGDRAGSCIGTGMPRVLDVRAVLLSHTARGLHDENAADSKSEKVIVRIEFRKFWGQLPGDCCYYITCCCRYVESFAYIYLFINCSHKCCQSQSLLLICIFTFEYKLHYFFSFRNGYLKVTTSMSILNLTTHVVI